MEVIQVRHEDCIRAAYFPPYYTAQNAGGWLKATSTNCPPSSPRILEESCEYSGPRPSPTNIFSPAVTKTAWAPSSCEGDGDGSDMWWEESHAHYSVLGPRSPLSREWNAWLLLFRTTCRVCGIKLAFNQSVVILRYLPTRSVTTDTRGEAEIRATQEHPASTCRRGTQDPPSHMGDRSEAGPEQTGVGYLCCCLTCQPAYRAWVSECDDFITPMLMKQNANNDVREHSLISEAE